ncbi:TolC family protein [Variovorax sp. J2P1-59]|uniref:efflux transporter outer membrane subunit n=1 Tax=Variovorax flavidus TaxID=3053501 RepID=UPI002574D9B6|nr:TolC family protein [Variovorax sp. J2P1-59]MDM0073392.1 TolC family protein [Variovorax sp. J2P1-59]
MTVQLCRTVRPLGLCALSAAAVLLAACTTVGPDYRQPADAIAGQPAAAAPFEGAQPSRRSPDAASAQPYSQAPLPAHWWRLYSDPLLDRLVEQALAHNTDLRQAVANLERVEALEAEVDGASKPTIGVNGGPSYGHVSGLSLLQPGYQPPSDFHYSAGVAVSYQLDLFGQIRRASEASHASTEAASAALDLVRVSVAAGTARAYADVCSTGLRLRSARKSAELQQEAVDASQRLQQAGRVGVIDVSRARSQAQQLLAALPPLQAQREGAVYRLATLTGTPPQAFSKEVTGCEAPPRVAGAVPVGDGAELLRRRPDIRQAERELAAATARIGVAVADRYPKITLGLSASSAGLADGFARRDTFAWSLGPLISWTLPNTGVVDARIAQAEAGTRMAAAKFDGTVLTALRETETALSAYAHELDRNAALQASRDEASTVAGQARRMYQSGKVGYLDALDAERSLASGEAALAASDAQLADDQVTLFLALGGGW